MLLLQLVAAVPGVPPAHDYITTGGLVLCTLITTVGVILGGQGWSNRKAINRAAENAEQAVALGAPTGNGFAEEVRQTLRRIEARQSEHARDIGGIRQEIRDERVERITLARALSNFIEKRSD